MRKIDKFLWNTKTKAQVALMGVKAKATGDETLIIKIMLMVVAVVLVIIFRDGLDNMIDTLLSSVQSKINEMFTPTT